MVLIQAFLKVPNRSTDRLAQREDLAQFLTEERALTIAVPIDEAGTIHAASLLYWHQAEPLRFYVVTSLRTEKCRLLKTQSEVQAACVVGTVKDVPFTLQMRGKLRVCASEGMDEVIEAYYAKRGSRDMDVVGQDDYVLLEFRPEWARFTDYGEGYDCQYQLELS